MKIKDIVRASTIICKKCGTQQKFIMPLYAAKTYYECPFCGMVYHSHKSDCCIFCSLGDTKCPKSQTGNVSVTTRPELKWTSQDNAEVEDL